MKRSPYKKRSKLGVTEKEFEAVLDNSYLDCSGLFDGKDEVRACEVGAQDVWMRSLFFLKDKKRPDFSQITPRAKKKCAQFPEFSEEREACNTGLDVIHKRLRKVNFEMGKNRRKGNT